jgi:hypothetical protein
MYILYTPTISSPLLSITSPFSPAVIELNLPSVFNCHAVISHCIIIFSHITLVTDNKTWMVNILTPTAVHLLSVYDNEYTDRGC